jgi:hypothetical protein
MNWFTGSDAMTPIERPSTEPQFISVVADVPQLYMEVPNSPRLILPSEGPPSPVHQWYGRIGNRWIVLECEVNLPVSAVTDITTEPGSVLIYTHFPEQEKKDGDWTSLTELVGLPSSVFVTRPLSIASRCTNPNLVVYRPNARGWKDTIYYTDSCREADNLLAFLKQDNWNESCFIGEPEPGGEWGIVQDEGMGRELILGAYPELNSTLKVACKMSLRFVPSTILTVKDLTGSHLGLRYQITQGRVIDRAVQP